MSALGWDDPRALARRAAFAAAARGAARTILSDLDGTLAPFAPTPSAARVPSGTLAALEALAAAGWTVAIASGRAWAEARALVPLPGVLVFGSHGAEDERGRLLVPDAAALAARLDDLAAAARPLVARFAGAWIERKPAGLAIHDRLVAGDARAAWAEARDAWVAGRDLRGIALRHGACVLELRAAGFDKGLVARRFAARWAAETSDESLVTLGDDRTDEDLFAAVEGRGLAVRVGEAERPSRAARRLRSPREVEEFLTALAAAARAGEAPRRVGFGGAAGGGSSSERV